MMEVLRRRLRRGPRDGGDRGREGPSWSPYQTTTTPASTAFVHRMSDTIQSSARPFKRLLMRVKQRLMVSKAPSPRDDVGKSSEASAARTTTLSSARTTTLSTARTTTLSSAASTMAHLESFKFCVWRRSFGWTMRRQYLSDEGQFVWLVALVTSVTAWENDGIRPGDVLETIGGESLADVTREEDVHALLKASHVGTVLRFRVRKVVDRCRLQRFFVVVDGQPIGASVVADGSDSVPVVIHVPPKATHSSKRPQTLCGDVLTEVNGENVVGWAMPDIMALVAKSRPFLTITFQRWTHTDCGPRCRDGARMVTSATLPSARLLLPRVRSSGTWRVRRSGDEFHDFGDEDDNDAGNPMDEAKTVVLVWSAGPLGVTLVKDDDAKMPSVRRLTGRGTVRGIEKLREGYHLASINGRPTHGRVFLEVLHELRRSKKPLWLVFLAPDVRVSMLSTCSRDASITNPRWSASSSLLSVDEQWDPRSTSQFPSTVTTTYGPEHE